MKFLSFTLPFICALLFLCACTLDFDQFVGEPIDASIDAAALPDAIGDTAPTDAPSPPLDSRPNVDGGPLDDAAYDAGNDAGSDAGPPVPISEACQRLRNVWFSMPEMPARCIHSCPWVARPGPCDPVVVNRCEGAIDAAAEVHDCVTYESALASTTICDPTACN